MAIYELHGSAPDGSQVDVVVKHTALTEERMTIGWCPGMRPGENDVAAMERMLASYGPPPAVRIFFQPGEAAGSWTFGVLSLVPLEADLIVSVKDWPFNVGQWLDSMPKRTGRTWLCVHHEPEQQKGGDPTPEVYKRHWSELAAAIRNHPRRAEIRLMPIYTRYYWQHNTGAFDRFFPTNVLDELDAVGWDIYDQLAKNTSYESSESKLATPFAIADRTGLGVAVCELGIKRRDTDPHGLGVVDSMLDFMGYAEDEGVFTVTWFHRDMENHHDLLAEPIRAAEAAALKSLMFGLRS